METPAALIALQTGDLEIRRAAKLLEEMPKANERVMALLNARMRSGTDSA